MPILRQIYVLKRFLRQNKNKQKNKQTKTNKQEKQKHMQNLKKHKQYTYYMQNVQYITFKNNDPTYQNVVSATCKLSYNSHFIIIYAILTA